jgi:hypothetical protein
MLVILILLGILALALGTIFGADLTRRPKRRA